VAVYEIAPSRFGFGPPFLDNSALPARHSSVLSQPALPRGRPCNHKAARERALEALEKVEKG
jgi:hypothetical protein